MELRWLRKFFRHPLLTDATEKLGVTKICASDEADCPVKVILEETINEWRTSKKEAWIELHLASSCQIEGFSIHWWNRSHANDMVVEACPVMSNVARWQTVYLSRSDMIYSGQVERVTAAKINSSNFIGQCFRIRMYDGNLDPIWKRFYFGIRYIELFGQNAGSWPENVFTRLALLQNNTKERRQQRVKEQQEIVDKAAKVKERSLISWKDILRAPDSEKVVSKCRNVPKQSITWQQNQRMCGDVRKGATRMPLTYTVSPRLRRTYVNALRQKRKPPVDLYSRFAWGCPRKTDDIAPKPKTDPSNALAWTTAGPGVATSSAERPGSALGMNESNTAIRDSRPGSCGVAKGIRPDSRGTVSTRTSTPLVKTRSGVTRLEESEDHFATSTVMESELPHGWVEYTHAETGRPYYHNALSDETTWEKPTQEPPLEPGWVAYEDDKGRRYYHCIATDEVTWVRPNSAATEKGDCRQTDWKSDDERDFYANPS